MTPAVSVVIPCFNLGAYLDAAVQSVLDQSYDDLEIVVVDDGSDDPATEHLLASFRRPKTRVIRTANQGLALARNTGLDASAGRYVSFLDADDMLEPAFLERTVALLEADSQLAFASCWLTAFGAAEFVWTPTDCGFPWLLAEDTVCTAALTRRDAVIAVGGYDSADWLAGWEDWDLAIALVNAGFAGRIIPEFLFRYRIRRGSMTSRINEPEYHARVYAGLLDKYNDTYARQAPGVAEAITHRISELEANFREGPPARPEVDVSGADWKAALLGLERHRRRLEEELKAPAAEPDEPARADALDWGALRRTDPVSRVWGLDRGQPIDRYYIERFLKDSASAIVGDVLEIKDPFYTRQFHTGARSVTVLDIAEQNQNATVSADLAGPDPLPVEGLDCVILTQTVHLIFDHKQVIANLRRALAPGGVILATLPCVSRIDYESGVDSDYWRFTVASARRLFAEQFGEENVEVVSFGNLLACTAFLQGLAVEDLTTEELDRNDPYFPLLIGVRATRAAGGATEESATPAATPVLNGRLEQVGCRTISGWAWNARAPHQRLRLEVWSGGERLGETWADGFREDLRTAGIGSGRHAFTFTSPHRLHGDEPLEVEVRWPGGEAELTGSPAAVVCGCSIDTDLLGYAVDAPTGPAPTSSPWIAVSGWVLGRDAPVDHVALVHNGKRIQTIPVRGVRPDLVEVYPETPWALRAGFSSRVSLVAISGELEIGIQAVLTDGTRYAIGEIRGARREPAGAVTALACGWPRQEGPQSLLGQSTPVQRVLVVDRRREPTQPGCARVQNLSQACDDPAGFLWICSGHEQVTEDFLVRALAALAADPMAAFAVGVEPDAGPPATLASVLGGNGLGAALVFRIAAINTIGGLDEGADGAEALQWDLAIRLAQGGHNWVQVEAAQADAHAITMRAGEDVIRWLYRKHAPLYREQLRDILLERERTIGTLLASNHLAERALEEQLRPTLRARRRERDRLGAKLRERPDAERTSRGTRAWGELRRIEPLSPQWGSERGMCVDRHYIEAFLQRHAADIRGSVLDFAGDTYARRYGGAQVGHLDVLDIDPGNPRATVVADLCEPSQIPSERYDCILLTQVLPYVRDPELALASCHRMLKPDGVLLLTVPTVGRINPESPDQDRWRFSAAATRQLLEATFNPSDIQLHAEGNRRAAVGLLLGLASSELGGHALSVDAPDAPLVVTARAIKNRQGAHDGH